MLLNISLSHFQVVFSLAENKYLIKLIDAGTDWEITPINFEKLANSKESIEKVQCHFPIAEMKIYFQFFMSLTTLS